MLTRRGMHTSRVASPRMRRQPPTTSTHPTNGAVMDGARCADESARSRGHDRSSLSNYDNGTRARSRVNARETQPLRGRWKRASCGLAWVQVHHVQHRSGAGQPLSFAQSRDRSKGETRPDAFADSLRRRPRRPPRSCRRSPSATTAFHEVSVVACSVVAAERRSRHARLGVRGSDRRTCRRTLGRSCP